MRIGIDARFNRSPGVERYYNSLISNIAAIDKENEYVVYYPSKKYLERHRIKQDNFTSILLPAYAYDPREQFLLAYQIRKDRIDVFHSPNSWVTPLLCPCPLVVTIHDVCPKTHPELIKLKARMYSLFMLPYSVRASDIILTVSQYSKKEIIRFYPRAEEKIRVTYNGIEEVFRQKRDERDVRRIKEIYGIKGEYLLSVGALMKHKNLLSLIQTYKQLPSSLKERCDLLIVGRMVPAHEDYVREVYEAVKGAQIKIVDFAEERDLPLLYAGATAFVFPSRQEGFGTPLAEAMASGTPVISSNATVMPEICGEAAAYFDPGSIEDMKDTIERVLGSKTLMKEMSIKGLERSRAFSWAIAAQQTLDAYRDVYRVKSSVMERRKG